MTNWRSGRIAGNRNRRDEPMQAPAETRRQRDLTRDGDTCTKPLAPHDGRVRIRDRGRRVVFRCRRRFQLYGSALAVCIDQTWSHPPPVCVGTRPCTCIYSHSLAKASVEISREHRLTLICYMIVTAWQLRMSTFSSNVFQKDLS